MKRGISRQNNTEIEGKTAQRSWMFYAQMRRLVLINLPFSSEWRWRKDFPFAGVSGEKERLELQRNSITHNPCPKPIAFSEAGHFGNQSNRGAVGETRTLTGVTPQRPQRCASTIPPRPHVLDGSDRLAANQTRLKRQLPTKYPAAGLLRRGGFPACPSAYSLIENVGIADAGCACGKTGRPLPLRRWDAWRKSSVRSG